MGQSKRLSCLSSEWLGKIGDDKRLVVRFSIVAVERGGKPQADQKSPIQEHSVVVSVSRSLENQWVSIDQRISSEENLRARLIQYARFKLRQALNSGQPLPEHLEMTTYTEWAPPDPNGLDPSDQQPEEVIVERNIGFRR